MPFTTAQLTGQFTQANQGVGPTAAQTTAILGIANANAAGQINDATAFIQLGALLQGTVGVAVLTYGYFGNVIPSVAGLAFLVSSTTNNTDLNDPYFAQFNQENRFLNFALNLAAGAGSPYGAAFQERFGALSFSDTVNLAYEQIIGSTAAINAGGNPANGKAFFLNSLPFYQALVTERAGIAPTSANFNIAVKAAIVGSILNEGVKAGFGTYSDSYRQVVNQLQQGLTTILGATFSSAFPAAAGTGRTGGSVSIGALPDIGDDHFVATAFHDDGHAGPTASADLSDMMFATTGLVGNLGASPSLELI